MVCPSCKGLRSVIKANPTSGEFEISDCSCQLKTKLYFCQDTGVILEVTEVSEGVMSILEHHPPGKLRRIINQFLFENDLASGVITPHH